MLPHHIMQTGMGGDGAPAVQTGLGDKCQSGAGRTDQRADSSLLPQDVGDPWGLMRVHRAFGRMLRENWRGLREREQVREPVNR